MSLTHKAILETEQYAANEGRRLHFYAKGEQIPLVTQGVWEVYQGCVQLSTVCLNGEEVLLGWAAPSNFFGLWLFQSLKGLHQFAPSSLHTSYQALSDVYLKWYSISEVETSPCLTQVILSQLGKRIQQTETLLAIVGQRRIEDRLHSLLVLLKHEMGQPVTEGTRLSYRLTHQNIANAIGTTRVTITRLLSQFQHQGWITIERDRHIILKTGAF